MLEFHIVIYNTLNFNYSIKNNEQNFEKNRQRLIAE